MKPKTILATILIALIIFGVASNFAFADSEDHSTGTANVSGVAPVLSSIELWNSAEDTDKNNTAIDAFVEYHLNFTVTSASTLANLDNATIWVFLASGDEDDPDDAQNHLTYTWVESTDIWACPLSASYIDQDDCEDPGTASEETVYEFRLSWKLPKVATYSNGGAPYNGWAANVTAYDDSDNFDSEKNIQFDVTFYAALTIPSDTTHAWTSVAPDSTENLITSPVDTDIDFTVICNANYDIQAEGNDTVLHVPGTANTIPIANVKVHETTYASALALTDGYVDIPGLTGETAPTTDVGTAVAVKVWLDVPDATPPGAYVYELWLNLQQT